MKPILVLFLLVGLGWSQAESNKPIIAANAANFAATAFNASGARYGAIRCIAEHDSRFVGNGGRISPNDELTRTLKISLPIDVAIGFVSWKFRKHKWATWLPVASASAQFAVGGMQFSAGCF